MGADRISATFKALGDLTLLRLRSPIAASRRGPVGADELARTHKKPGSRDFTLWEGDVDRGHDWAGFGSGLQSSASISTNHPDIGSGSVTVGEETPPRIPKTPNVPNNLRVESVLPTSFGVRYNRGDDMGAAIVQDQAHWYAGGPAGQGTLVWEDNGPAGYTNPAEPPERRSSRQERSTTSTSDPETPAGGGRGLDRSAPRRWRMTAPSMARASATAGPHVERLTLATRARPSVERIRLAEHPIAAISHLERTTS